MYCFRLCVLLVSVSVAVYLLTPNIDQLWWTQHEDYSCFNQTFKGVLLVIVFNYPHYSHIPLLKSLYNKAFPNMVFCGAANSSRFEVETVKLYKGYFGYDCLTRAIERSVNYTGYLVMSDDVLLNFWNLPREDVSRVWEGPRKPITVGVFEKARDWYWWKSRWGLQNCLKALNETNYREGGGRLLRVLSSNDVVESNGGCHGGRSDIFYLPHKHANTFTRLAKIFRKHNVFIEIAVPTMLRMLEGASDIVRLEGVYLPGRAGSEPVMNSEHLWENYSPHIHFIHPIKLHYGLKSRENIFMLNHFIRKKIEKFVNCSPPL